MLLSWLQSCLPFRSGRPLLPPPRPGPRRRSRNSALKSSYRPTLQTLEERALPSGSGLGGFSWFFTPPGPATHLQVIVPENVTSGSSFKVLVEAEDASNRLATGFTDQVALSLGTADSSAAVPTPYTFTTADHGIHVFTVTLSATGPQTITATDTTPGSTVTFGSASTTVNAAPTLSQLVVVTPEQAAVGVASPVTVEALDASGHLIRNFTGTVTLSTSDAAATGLPSSYTFSSSDHGHHTFQVTFETPDTGTPVVPTTVTATDGSITNTASVTVSPAATVTHLGVFMIPGAAVGQPTQIIVAALNAANQPVAGYTGTVSFSSSDSAATISATRSGTQTALTSFTPYQFTAADAGVHRFTVTFNTTGQQTFTATDMSNNLTDTINVDVFTPLPHHGFGFGFGFGF